MKRIICSAQSFGYGPASKLVTLVKLINDIEGKKVKIDFIGNNTALTYIQQNKSLFNKIIKFHGEYPDLHKYNLAISVMEPQLAIWSSLQNKKTFYFDSLFWFWSWNNKTIKLIEKNLKYNNNLSFIDKWKSLINFDDHHLQYIAHRLSNRSFVQTFINIIKKQDHFRKKINFEEIGAIVDISHKKDNLKRNKILISLSGILSPINKIEDAVKYSKLVFKLLEEFITETSNKIEFILTTNPLVASKITSSNKKIKITSLNHNDFLDTLNKSILLFTPAGITTLYESLLYNVPVILLPEQHDGHFLNYSRLAGNSISIKKLRKIFPEMLFNLRINRIPDDNPDQELMKVQNLIKKSITDFKLIEDMKKVLITAKKIINNDVFRKQILYHQQKTVLSHTKIFTKEQCQKILM